MNKSIRETVNQEIKEYVDSMVSTWLNDSDTYQEAFGIDPDVANNGVVDIWVSSHGEVKFEKNETEETYMCLVPWICPGSIRLDNPSDEFIYDIREGFFNDEETWSVWVDGRKTDFSSREQAEQRAEELKSLREELGHDPEGIMIKRGC